MHAHPAEIFQALGVTGTLSLAERIAENFDRFQTLAEGTRRNHSPGTGLPGTTFLADRPGIRARRARSFSARAREHLSVRWNHCEWSGLMAVAPHEKRRRRVERACF
jgi:hypothetical protein